MRVELVLAGGSSVPLETSVVVGRDPVAPRDLPGTIATAISDDMSVSKTHALIEEAHGTVWVTDLGSSNGTEIIDIDGTERSLQKGIPAVAPIGSTIRIGSASEFTVRMAATNSVVPLHPAALAEATVARRDLVDPPPAAAPVILGVGPTVATSQTPLPTSYVAATIEAPSPVTPAITIGDPEAATAARLKTRRIGGWILAVWGVVTGVWTVVRGDYYGYPTPPGSLFWYPSGIFNVVERGTVMAAFPLMVGVLAGWMLVEPESKGGQLACSSV